MQAVGQEAEQPGAFLSLTEIFGDLGRNERFRTAYLNARESLSVNGPLGALQALEHEKSRDQLNASM